MNRVDREDSGGYWHLKKEDKAFSDYPVFYKHNGRVGYDHPEKIPKKVQSWVEKVLSVYHKK